MLKIFDEIKNSSQEKFGGEFDILSEIDKIPLAICPFCKSEIKEGNKNFYCTGYYKTPSCNFVIWKEMYGRKTIQSDVKQLCENGKTEKRKGFVSQKGAEYSGFLVLNKSTKKIEMSFK